EAFPANDGKPYEIIDGELYVKFFAAGNAQLELIVTLTEPDTRTTPLLREFDAEERQYFSRRINMDIEGYRPITKQSLDVNAPIQRPARGFLHDKQVNIAVFGRSSQRARAEQNDPVRIVLAHEPLDDVIDRLQHESLRQR